MKVLKVISSWISGHGKYIRLQPSDFAVYVVLNILIFLTLYYGVIVAFPLLMGSSNLLLFLNYAFGVWLYIACQSNLQLIRCRESSVNCQELKQQQKIISPQQQPKGNSTHNQSSDKCYESSKGKPKGTNSKKSECSSGASNNSNNSNKSKPKEYSDNWHTCNICRVTVPPRSWHCSTCRICILRRDHHCVFAMTCIGRNNQANFMGFLFYTALGTTYATVQSFIIALYIQKVSFGIWLLRNVLIFYIIIFDFSINNILASLNFVGCVFSVGVLGYYVLLGLKGQTSADFSRNISRQVRGRSEYSLSTMAEFLGPNPFLRIIWPFHQVILNNVPVKSDIKIKKTL